MTDGRKEVEEQIYVCDSFSAEDVAAVFVNVTLKKEKIAKNV